MHIESRLIASIMLLLLAALGCTEATPSKPGAVERAVPTKPTLTSTAPHVSPKPVKEKQLEPSVVEIAEAPPIEEDPSFEPTLGNMDGLTIQRLVTASEVERREPVAASSVFGPGDERVYAFIEVSNESEEDKTLLVHFIGPDEQVNGGIELHIPPTVPRWRTWAHTRHAKKPGLWRVEIRSIDGNLIGALPFEVEPGY